MEILNWGGLRFRLVLLLLIAIAPVFGLFTYSAAKSQQAALDLARANLQSEALLAALSQQRQVERTWQLLNDIAGGPSIKNPRLNLCGSYLRNLQSQNPGYTNLGVLSLDGRVVCQSLEINPGADFSQRTFFQQVLATRKFSIGDLVIGPASDRAIIAFGIPVYADDGVMNGVAFAALDVAALAKALDPGALLDGAQLRVLDRRGTVLSAQATPAIQPGSPDPDALVLQAIKARRSGIQEDRDADGLERIYAYAPVTGAADSGLWVAISVPRSLVTAGPRQAFLINLAALLGLTAFGIVCAWWFGGRLIVKPARDILKEAAEVADGNLAARVAPGSRYVGELGEIAASFNRMAQALQTRENDIEKALQRIDKERALLELIVSSMSEGVLAVDTDGHFLLFNDTVTRLFAAHGDDAVLSDWRQNHQLMTLDGKTAYASAEQPLTQALAGTSIDNWDVLFRKPGQDDRILRVSAKPLRDSAGELMGAVAVFNDITDLKSAENFVREQQEVLALIARGVPLRQSLEAIVRLIESRDPDSRCSLLLVEDGYMRHGAAVSLPASFIAQIDGLAIGASGGACGAAALGKQVVIVEDIATDPLMQDFRSVAEAYHLRSCWSVPVLSGNDDVLATFAIYHQKPCRPQRKDTELLEIASRLARIALERWHAEQALVTSEARFRELAESTLDVFYSRDTRTGAILYVSPSYEKIWGRSCESLYAQPGSYLDAVLPEDRPILMARANQLTSDVEYRIVTPDGQQRWIRDIGYPVFEAGGELQRVVGTARDVTDRKLADFELARTNRALQMLSRTALAVQRHDDEASLLAAVCAVAVDVGQYRMAWVGYAQDDAVRSIRPMAHAGQELGYLTELKLSWSKETDAGRGLAGRVIRSGVAQHYGDIPNTDKHFNFKQSALQRGYISVICLPLRDGQRTFGVLALYSAEAQQFNYNEVSLLQELADNLAFGIGSLRAQVERRRSEDLAREAAAVVREQASLLDRAQDAIMVRNLDRTIRYWNKGAERLYGWTAAEVMGRTMDHEMYRDPEILTQAMRQTLANGGDWTGELEQRARDDSVVYIEARWTVLRDRQGAVSGVLGINTDIRERKKVEQEILQLNASLEERVQQRTAQLEFANKQLEAFSYSVSHDLRTPLSTIDGFSSLLGKAMDNAPEGAMGERSRHYLARIRAGASQMGELIDAMLALALVSRANLRWEPVDLSDMAQTLLKSYQEREPERVVKLEVEPGLRTQGDPRLLKQVLDNLLGNAWKFSALSVCTDICFASEVQANGETAYFVRDQGAGFDMAYVDKLFGAFQRLHSPSEFAGTGIGLTTVQRIILRHGGRVWAESAPGQGATFYFTLGTVAHL